MKTKVTYDKQKRAWRVKNDTLDTFTHQKNGALLYALEHDHSELYQKVIGVWESCDRDEKLLDRLLNAAKLLTKGHVSRHGERYEVRSQTSDKIYHVTFSGIPKTWQCDCQAYVTGRVIETNSYGPLCKHCAAALLSYLMDVEDSCPSLTVDEIFEQSVACISSLNEEILRYAWQEELTEQEETIQQELQDRRERIRELRSQYLLNSRGASEQSRFPGGWADKAERNFRQQARENLDELQHLVA